MKIQTLSLLLSGAIALSGLGAAALAQSRAEPASGPAVAHGQAGDADGAFIAPLVFSEPTGEALYKRVCAGCHMPDAKGAVGAGHYPALAKNEKLAASGYPLYIVLHGLNGMPAVGGMMTDKQVADVVNYVRTHFGNKYRDAVTVADVKAAR